jgi:transcriptional regulator with XRE-family HTH domain
VTEVLLHEKSRQLGAKIKYYRTLGGMNQTILANKLGITYQHLSRIECGKQTPSFSLLIALAEELHVDMAELISNGRQLYY